LLATENSSQLHKQSGKKAKTSPDDYKEQDRNDTLILINETRKNKRKNDARRNCGKKHPAWQMGCRLRLR